MKAAVRDRYGGPEVVEVRDVDRPVPGGDGVVVRVVAASVNRADLDFLYGLPKVARAATGLRAPRVKAVGVDVAGVVDAVGPEVTRFKLGDRVFADLYPFSHGAFAEYASAPERAFAPIPAGLSFEQAATLPHSGILALQGLRRRNGRTVGPGDRVLIDGASGNVGPFAVQIAKDLGAEVTAVCSADKADFVRSLGADHVLDYRTTDPTRTGQRYDWILAVASHHSLPGIPPCAATWRRVRHARRHDEDAGRITAPRAAAHAGRPPADGHDAVVEAVRSRRRGDARQARPRGTPHARG